MNSIALICLLAGLNIGRITHNVVIENIMTSSFLIYICATRQWNLLLCGVLFFIFSFSHFASSISLFKQIPAIGILTVFVISFIFILPCKKARTWNQWAKVGKIDLFTILLIIGTGIISMIALISWAKWTNNLGIALNMAESIRQYPKIFVICLVIPLFAFLNSFAEEITYRGVLQTALLEGFGNYILAIVFQATAFAALHFEVGFPNGSIGYILTFIYGIILGYLRKLSNGLLAPILCHIIADLIIFYYVVNLVWKNST